MDRHASSLRITVWPMVVSLLIHGMLGFIGLKVVPPVSALPGVDSTRLDAPGTLTWLEAVPPPPHEPPPPEPAPAEKLKPDRPTPPEQPREVKVGEEGGDPGKETLMSSDQAGEHAAKLSTVEQPALTNQLGGGKPTPAGSPGSPSPSTPPQPQPAAPPKQPQPQPAPAETVHPAPLSEAKAPAGASPESPSDRSTPKTDPPEVQATAPAEKPSGRTGNPDAQDKSIAEPGLPAVAAPPAPPIGPGSGLDGKPSDHAAAGSPAREAESPPITPGKSESPATGVTEGASGPDPRAEDNVPQGVRRLGGEGHGESLSDVISDLLQAPPPRPEARAMPELTIPIPVLAMPSLLLDPMPPSPSLAPDRPVTRRGGAGSGGSRPVDPGPGLTGDPKLDDIAWLAEKVADPTSKRRSAEYHDGRVTAGEGVELIVTRRPESTTFTRLRGASRNPTFDIVFTRSGVVKDVVAVRGSGNRTLDEDISNAIHFWRARGKELSELGEREDATLTVRLTVLLLGE